MDLLKQVTKGKTPQAPRILVYGEAGVGKSTFAAGGNNPVFIDLENGLNSLDVQKFPVCKTFDDAEQQLRALAGGGHEFKTVCIDSADWLERLIHEKVCRESGNAVTMEAACGGYGKAYSVALKHWKTIIDILDVIRSQKITVVIIAHAKIEKFEDPTHGTYDRYSPRLHKSSTGLLCEAVDVIGLASRKVRLAKDESGRDDRKIATPIGRDGGERRLFLTPGPSAIAKNRYGLGGDIPLDMPTLVQEIRNYFAPVAPPVDAVPVEGSVAA